MNSKKEIRNSIKEKLRTQDPAESDRCAKKIHQMFFQSDFYQKTKCVLIYLSRGDEVETRPVIKKMFSDGKRVVLPRVDKKTQTLELRQIKNINNDVEQGTFGIMEPRTDVTTKVFCSEVDCAVLPGIAFERNGKRLGRGGGFFDKLLGDLPKSTKVVAFAYPFQVIGQIPTESHDRSVDIVLTA